MDPKYDAATSDAEAIMACLGPLAIMASAADRMGRHGASILSNADPTINKLGNEILDDSAKALRVARERIDTVMQDLGNYFNNNDSCPATMMSLTAPVFEILQKRKDGISLDD
jgi:hypothetical protein